MFVKFCKMPYTTECIFIDKQANDIRKKNDRRKNASKGIDKRDRERERDRDRRMEQKLIQEILAVEL